MRSVRGFLLVSAALTLSLSACGGDVNNGDGGDGTTTTASPTATTAGGGGGAETTTTVADGGGSTQAPPAVGEAGSFTVNETEFAVTLLNRCIPFSDEAGNVDLQALAQGGQGAAKLNLSLLGDFLDVSVDGSGISNEFGSIAFGSDQVVESSEIAGDRWSGSATVADSLGSGETVDITWDVMVPDEIRDCSL